MVRYLALIPLIFLSALGIAQDKEKTFIISRNIGFTKLSPVDSVKIMGFVETLKAPVKIPGPTLRYAEGDSVEITLWNVSQGAPHTIHLHGLDVDQQNDGVPMLSFEVEHMQKGYYRFKAPHPGTYLYHCHVVSPIHVQAGMYGLLIVDPKDMPGLTWENGYVFKREYSFLASEIDTHWHTVDFFKEHHSGTSEHFPFSIPSYRPQYFLVNGTSGLLPDEELDTIKAQEGGNTLLRLANVGFEGNYYVFPKELNALVISSDGRPLPTAKSIDTLFLFPGERYQVLLQPESGALLEAAIDLHFYALYNGKDLSKRALLVQVNDFSSLPENSKEVFHLYPNPATDELTIELKGTQRAHLSIYSTSGEKVLECPVSYGLQRLGLSSLESATYTVQVQYENGEIVRQTLFKVGN